MTKKTKRKNRSYEVVKTKNKKFKVEVDGEVKKQVFEDAMTAEIYGELITKMYEVPENVTLH